MLLKLLAHFSDKSGKYAIQGFPHKLGLLLHGPPGTVSSIAKCKSQFLGENFID